MSEYNSKCGPDATDNYDRYTHWGNGNYSRSHVINGTGTVTNNTVNKGAITGTIGMGETYSSTQNGYVTTNELTGGFVL